MELDEFPRWVEDAQTNEIGVIAFQYVDVYWLINQKLLKLWEEKKNRWTFCFHIVARFETYFLNFKKRKTTTTAHTCAIAFHWRNDGRTNVGRFFVFGVIFHNISIHHRHHSLSWSMMIGVCVRCLRVVKQKPQQSFLSRQIFFFSQFAKLISNCLLYTFDFYVHVHVKYKLQHRKANREGNEIRINTYVYIMCSNTSSNKWKIVCILCIDDCKELPKNSGCWIFVARENYEIK